MCCYLENQNAGKVNIRAIYEHDEENQVYDIHGVYTRTPGNLAERIFRYFQRMELIEKISEIADEIFHLFGSLMQLLSPVEVYQTLRKLHHAAHDVEQVLHAFCFFGDVYRLVFGDILRLTSGKFLEYKDEKQTKYDFLRCTARVFHAFSHFLATASFLSKHKLIVLNGMEKIFPYGCAFSAMGYAIWTTTLIWRRHQGELNDHFKSDLGIHLSGFSYEFFSLMKTSPFFIPYFNVINKIIAVAGIIRATCIVQRLLPDEEVFTGKFVMPKNFMHHHH